MPQSSRLTESMRGLQTESPRFTWHDKSKEQEGGWQFKNAWELMLTDRTERMGRETHTPRVDEATGKVFSLEPVGGSTRLTEPSTPFSDDSDPKPEGQHPSEQQELLTDEYPRG